MTWPSRWKNLQAGFATSKLHLSAPKEKAPRGRSEEGEGRAELGFLSLQIKVSACASG